MINYVKRADLNVAKYDSCIDNAINTRIYAFSWYLDIVADQWDALVLNDYEAVMPLPWRRKYAIKYIYTPCWVQQLGIFSKLIVDSTLTKEFIQSIPNNFLKVTLQLNSQNEIVEKSIMRRTNYILQLNQTYGNLYAKYRKVRKRRTDLHNINDNVILSFNGDYREVINVFKAYNSYKIEENDYKKLKQLCRYLNSKNELVVIDALDLDGTILGGAIFLIDAKRITYLFSAIKDQGRRLNVMTLIIDSLIKKYANTNYVLDFEGSNIESIAFFFKSFGAKKEIYYLFEKSTLNNSIKVL